MRSWLSGSVRSVGRTPLVAGVRRVLAVRLAAGRQAWRRSLQLRLVVITLVVSGVLVGAFGVLVASMITEGLVNARVSSAKVQVTDGAQDAAAQLDVVKDPGDPSLTTSITGVLTRLAATTEHGTVLLMPSNDKIPVRPQSSSANTDQVVAAIPASLRAQVSGGKLAHQFVSLDLDDGTHAYLISGSPVRVSVGQFELYYLYPLNNEEQAAELVRTTVIVTGATLVVLLAVLAALTTRLVVTPVRAAARVAQRLSAGLLDQRMAVRGEDELAQLAAAFNQMAENLQRQIIRLEEMSRLQRRFTSDVSHELRTPLTTVRMAADLIFASRDEFDPAVARSAELLHAELDRFEGLLTDLLEISRFDAGFAVLDAEHTDLVPLVKAVAHRLEPLARRVGSPIDLRLPDSAVIAEVDPRRVERILRNLIGNAVEHGEGQPVEVTLATDSIAVAVTVRDHGIGLAPGEEKLVFNRFWRADPSRARQTGGTGLGLSISLEDARLHHGWLEAWGTPGQGSLFRLTLPARSGDRLISSPLRLIPARELPAATSHLVVPEVPAPAVPDSRPLAVSDSPAPAASHPAPAARSGATRPRGAGPRDGGRNGAGPRDGGRNDGGLDQTGEQPNATPLGGGRHG